jgi:enoyl-CoA hydratase/carnithine racemase
MAHWTLPRLVGGAVAAELLLTGRTFDGAQAAALGIASRAVPAGEVLAVAMDIARDIATNVAPMSAALTKRLLWDTMSKGYGPREVAALETELHRRVMGGADAREGVAAFLDRRPPRWTASVSRQWEPLSEPTD